MSAGGRRASVNRPLILFLSRGELDTANKEIARQAELKKEHDKLLDFKVQEYQREKADREQKLEEFLEAQKREKELELKKMRDKQQKASGECELCFDFRALSSISGQGQHSSEKICVWVGPLRPYIGEWFTL